MVARRYNNNKGNEKHVFPDVCGINKIHCSSSRSIYFERIIIISLSMLIIYNKIKCKVRTFKRPIISDVKTFFGYYYFHAFQVDNHYSYILYTLKLWERNGDSKVNLKKQSSFIFAVNIAVSNDARERGERLFCVFILIEILGQKSLPNNHVHINFMYLYM